MKEIKKVLMTRLGVIYQHWKASCQVHDYLLLIQQLRHFRYSPLVSSTSCSVKPALEAGRHDL